MNVAERIADLNAQIAALGREYRAFIADKSIPLEERWAAYLSAPSNMKREDSYTTHFRTLDGDFFMYDGTYHCERHQTVELAEVVTYIEEELESMEADPQWYSDRQMAEIRAVDLTLFKEEILEQNVHSFKYDW